MIQDAFLFPFLNWNLISQKLSQSWTFTEQSENWHLIFLSRWAAVDAEYCLYSRLSSHLSCCHAPLVTRPGSREQPSINLVTGRGMILP